MAKLTTFLVGYCTHPACMALKGAGLKSRCFPSRAYLIETKQGVYLLDTGYASHFMDAARGIYKLYPIVTPIHFEAQQSLSQQLANIGISSHDITGVVASHFHADHIAGLRDFPQARIICAADAWASIQDLSGFAALRKAFLPHLIPPTMASRLQLMESLNLVNLPAELKPFTTGYALNDEILLVNLPGHAAGQIGAFIKQDSGWTLLASDAAWSTEGFEELRGPSELSFLVQDNRKSYYQTLQKLHQLHLNGGVDIQLTHQVELE